MPTTTNRIRFSQHILSGAPLKRIEDLETLRHYAESSPVDTSTFVKRICVNILVLIGLFASIVGILLLFAFDILQDTNTKFLFSMIFFMLLISSSIIFLSFIVLVIDMCARLKLENTIQQESVESREFDAYECAKILEETIGDAMRHNTDVKTTLIQVINRKYGSSENAPPILQGLFSLT